MLAIGLPLLCLIVLVLLIGFGPSEPPVYESSKNKKHARNCACGWTRQGFFHDPECERVTLMYARRERGQRLG
jgi:hypothetical protein